MGTFLKSLHTEQEKMLKSEMNYGITRKVLWLFMTMSKKEL